MLLLTKNPSSSGWHVTSFFCSMGESVDSGEFGILSGCKDRFIVSRNGDNDDNDDNFHTESREHFTNHRHLHRSKKKECSVILTSIIQHILSFSVHKIMKNRLRCDLCVVFFVSFLGIAPFATETNIPRNNKSLFRPSTTESGRDDGLKHSH